MITAEVSITIRVDPLPEAPEGYSPSHFTVRSGGQLYPREEQLDHDDPEEAVDFWIRQGTEASTLVFVVVHNGRYGEHYLYSRLLPGTDDTWCWDEWRHK